MKHFSNFFIFLLRNQYILYLVGLIRYYYFRIFYPIKTLKSPNAIDISNQHNLDGLFRIKTQFFMPRFDRLIYSVIANERFSKTCKTLIIGPRSESDILKLFSYGYKNIKAIDLITYSPKIEIMDAHNITYRPNSFDCIFCGWTLPYSNHPNLIADSIIKVVKNNGLVSVGIEYSPDEKIKSVEDIKKLFKGYIKNIFFQYDAELKFENKKKLHFTTGCASSQILISFVVKK